MSANLWRKIFETASEDEIQYILHKTDLPIPGFRPDKRKTIPRFLIIKTLIQTVNSEQKKTKSYAKKIRETYEKLLDTNSDHPLPLEDSVRRKIVELILTGNSENLIEAEDLSLKLASQTPQQNKEALIENNDVQILIDSNVEQEVEQEEWKVEFKKLEREMKKKFQNLEQKYENKIKETNDLKKNITILEKKQLGEVKILNERITEISEENELYQEQISKLQEIAISLEEKINIKEKELIMLLQTVELYKKENEEYREKIEHMQIKITHKELSDNKIKVLVIGEIFQKQDNLKNFDLEFVQAQKISEEELVKRSEVSAKVILLSWTMTMAMQRKIKRIVPKQKLEEFYDYNTFCKYISEGDNKLCQ